MTNEQAIKELQESYDNMRNYDIDESESYLMQALDMAIKALQEQADRNEFYNWDAPIRHKADGEYILKSEAIRVASGYCHPSNIAKELEKLPSVAIPSEEPQTGNWLLDDSDDSMICDKCECTVYALDMVDGEIHYCPNCGDKKEGITWID